MFSCSYLPPGKRKNLKETTKVQPLIIHLNYDSVNIGNVSDKGMHE